MEVREVLVRFFRSFNFDYLRKYHNRTNHFPWELMEDGSWYPFVRVPLAEGITTVVGANESGKSQILDALKIALLGEGVIRRDFCRYSKFFVVEETMRLPDFGVVINCLSEADRAALAPLCSLESDSLPPELTVIRRGDGTTQIWHRAADEWISADLSKTNVKKLNALLPRPFEMRSDLPLPDQVPIAYLAEASLTRAAGRKQRHAVVRAVAQLTDKLRNADSVKSSAEQIAAALGHLDTPSERLDEDELQLARDLLLKIAGIGPAHFADLLEAISDGKDGYVNGVQEQINRALATRLNFRKWWTQDSSFQLRVAVREADLAFIIRDRTGTDYSFGERSNGMKYFLSYFVQYLAHDAPEQGTEVLLMDEPDAFLSSQGQRDLLRVFEALAFPDDGTKPCPVVYVTHSPFLMDKNHAERIRVLEKGNGDEGTRVVRDAARNHYEPLRSAFGGFVAETSFIGTCNVMLEGQSDQVLLAGMSRRLQRAGSTSSEFLDLNETTLVPAGGASQIPYLTYLARGRDVEKPAVVVLLDGDEAGVSARRAIRKGGAYRKALVHDDYVLLLTDDSLSLTSDRATGPIEIEDLVPAELAVAAARRYLDEFLGCELQGVDSRSVNCDDGVLSGINDAVRGVVEDFTELDKVGFARHVITAANDPDSDVSQTSLERLDGNFKELFRVLGLLCRRAVNDEAAIRTSDRLQRATDTFLQDHPKSAQKNHVTMLFEELDHSLDQTRESEEARAEMRRIADVHSLSVNPGTPVEDLDTLLADLSGLASLSRHRSQE